MPKKRDPKRDEAFEIWKQHDGNITNREIAKQLDVPEKTISAWKSRDKWNVVLQKNDCSTTNKKVPKKARSPSDKKQKRSGNPNPKNQFSKRNTAAVKHGLFAKYLPQETFEIVQQLEDFSPVDILWINIEMQFASIMRAQQIMFVANKDDLSKELKRTKESFSKNGESTEEEFELQFAWDKQANFLVSVSRAMAELRSLIKQFNEMANEDDERKLKLEQMQLNVEKLKIEVRTLGGDTENDAHAQNSDYEKALNSQAEDVFSDEEVDDNG